MFTVIIWRFLILETFVLGAMCTTCPRKHPQNYFCSSEFVLNLEVISRLAAYDDYGYSAVIKRVYRDITKALDLTVNGTMIVKMTKDQNFTIGENYIIFGRYKAGRVYTAECNGNVRYAETSGYHRTLLGNHYENSCNCVNSFGNFSMTKICHWEYDYKVFHGRSCSWNEGSEYKQCVRNRTQPTEPEMRIHGRTTPRT